MCTGENDDFCPEEPEEAVESPPASVPVVEGAAEAPLHRRKFLKAAAIGTAVAAFANKGISFGPLTAYADDLSLFQCTANDVRIVGAGQIINEPCTCNGTFNATVNFTVENNAASARGCITLHLVPVTINGQVFNPGDVILQGTIPGKTTQTMTGTINNYPCGSGLVCFGSASGDGRFRCTAGECSTVSWTVPGQDTCPPDKQISSKCRHQQICIQGRGTTTIDCDTSTAGNQTNCTLTCGTTTTVRLCTSSPTSLGPFTFKLTGQPDFGPTTDTCHDFTVGPITGATPLTGTVVDKDGCTSSASTTLSSQVVASALVTAGAPDCDGKVHYTISNCDANASYSWQEVNCQTDAPIGNPTPIPNCSAGFDITWPKGSTHCILVTATLAAGACAATSQKISATIPSQVVLTLPDPTGGCDGVLTFTASASGGVGPYTFTWRVNDVDQSDTDNVFTFGPVLDGTCQKIQVKVVDSNGCEGDGARTKTVSQCVTTTLGTP